MTVGVKWTGEGRSLEDIVDKDGRIACGHLLWILVQGCFALLRSGGKVQSY